jgi:hypothetical protein
MEARAGERAVQITPAVAEWRARLDDSAERELSGVPAALLAPLLRMGVLLIVGSDSRIWSWQRARRTRYPAIAYVVFAIVLRTLGAFLCAVSMPPVPQGLEVVATEETSGATARVPFSAIASAVAAFLYVGVPAKRL